MRLSEEIRGTCLRRSVLDFNFRLAGFREQKTCSRPNGFMVFHQGVHEHEWLRSCSVSGPGGSHCDLLGCAWQSEVEGRAPSGVSRCPEAAAMRLHNGAADRQAHAGTRRFGRKERIKDLVRLLGWQSHACVADGD